MHTILRQDIPLDFTYYRTGSRVFCRYAREYSWGDIVAVPGQADQFMRVEPLLGRTWSHIDAEKIDIEPDIDLLKKSGYKHGIVYWSPMRRTDKPRGWVRLPAYWARKWLHASRTAFSVLDTPEYWTKWSSEARNHRKKTLELIRDNVIRIESSDDIVGFCEAYRTADIADPNKRIHTQWLDRMIQSQGMEDKRIYLGYIGDQLVAGAMFIDMGTTSEYFMSFYPRESRAYQFGIAILDRWMADSYAMGVKYCDLDHMWDRGNPLGQKGYTQFKSGIADHDVYFHDMWVKIF